MKGDYDVPEVATRLVRRGRLILLVLSIALMILLRLVRLFVVSAP